MKNKLTSILLGLLAIFVVSCESTISDARQMNETSYWSESDTTIVGIDGTAVPVSKTKVDILAEVDTASVRTFNDFDKLNRKLFSDFHKFETERFRRYEDLRGEKFHVYIALSDSAIREVRAKDRELYYAWLDARELRDYQRYSNIEKHEPVFESYRRAELVYSLYNAYTDSLYEVYKHEKDSAYEAYTKKKDFAYEAYIAHGEKL